MLKKGCAAVEGAGGKKTKRVANIESDTVKKGEQARLETEWVGMFRGIVGEDITHQFVKPFVT